ncbi:MAG: hypothetical protein U1E46_02420 [Hyphomicrobiales bacterium]
MALVLAISLSGCASVSVQRVTDPVKQTGIRYWRPAPYILVQEVVTADKAVVCDAKVMTLPDKSEEYAINFTPGMGTAEVKPTLTDGWRLDGLDANLDSKTADNIKALAELAKASGATISMTDNGAKPGQRKPTCNAGIFRPVYSATGQIVEFRKVKGLGSPFGT